MFKAKPLIFALFIIGLNIFGAHLLSSDEAAKSGRTVASEVAH